MPLELEEVSLEVLLEPALLRGEIKLLKFPEKEGLFPRGLPTLPESVLGEVGEVGDEI